MKCDMPDCSGQGTEGNANIINGKRVCDYCHAKMEYCVICFKGTDTIVAIDQEFFYEQPHETVRYEMLRKEEVRRLLGNKAFLKMVLGPCEIRACHFEIGPVMQLKELPPEPQEKRYTI